MADNKEKTYTPEEMAIAALTKCEELYKSSKLAKANTSHELETGEEPNNDDAEAPEQLQVGEVTKPGQGEQKNKKKKNADGSDMEYEEGDEEFAEGEAPEHEEGMDTETKAAHDATEEESDEEELEEDEDIAAQEADEADADKIEDKEEGKEKKKKPFEKSEKMTKSLFRDKCVAISETKYKKTKEDCFYDIKWCLEKLQKMKELKWTIEDEAPEAKGIFEKEYKKEKAKLCKYIKEYNSMKKSEDFDEEEVETLNKAEQIMNKKPSKLKEFMKKKLLKKKALNKKQGVPKGADPAVHERCVKDVKAQGHDKSSSFAICNAAKAGQKKKAKTKKMEKFLGLGGTQTSGQIGGTSQGKPPKPAPGTSIADQIGFGKSK